MEQGITKRQLLLAAASVGAMPLYASGAKGQDTAEFDIRYTIGDAGSFHQALVFEAGNQISDGSPLNTASLAEGLHRLVDLKVLEDVAAAVLGELIGSIIEAVSLDKIIEVLGDWMSKVYDELKDVAKTIADIVESSVFIAQEIMSSAPIELVREAIAHDVFGALQGAQAGAKMAPTLPPQARVWVVAACALAAATATSVLGFYAAEQ